MPAYNPLYEDEAIRTRACYKCVILEALENSLSQFHSLTLSLSACFSLLIVRVLRSLLSLVCYQFWPFSHLIRLDNCKVELL